MFCQAFVEQYPDLWYLSPDLSPFLLDSDLGRFVTKSTFNFHCVLFRPYDILQTRGYLPVLCTQPKISVTYLIFTAELTHGLACSDSCSTGTYCS